DRQNPVVQRPVEIGVTGVAGGIERRADCCQNGVGASAEYALAAHRIDPRLRARLSDNEGRIAMTFLHLEPGMLRRYAVAIACIAALALTSCGIKGPLKLPSAKPAASPVAAPTTEPGAPLTRPPPSSPPPAEPPTAPGSSGAGKQ